MVFALGALRRVAAIGWLNRGTTGALGLLLLDVLSEFAEGLIDMSEVNTIEHQ